MITHNVSQFTPAAVRLMVAYYEKTGEHGVTTFDHHAVVSDHHGVRVFEMMPCDHCGSTDPDRNIDDVEFVWGPFSMGTATLCEDCVDDYDGADTPNHNHYRMAWTGHHA